MNKNDIILHSGWMTKSPPEKKILGPWRLFKYRWKRRYFVLLKPAGSLPGQYTFTYYSDDQCRRRKGHIDLEQCDQVIESLQSDLYENLFSIKTTHKNRERTYFLSTENEEDMAIWVRNLCHACGLKQEDQPELPPYSSNGTIPSEKPIVTRSEFQQSRRRLPPKPDSFHENRVSDVSEHDHDDQTYRFVSEFKSCPRSWMDDSNESAYVPPFPPERKRDTIDRMQTSVMSVDSLYKVPPGVNHTAPDDYYDVPPSRQLDSQVSSVSGDSNASDSTDVSNVYQSPPAPRQYQQSVNDNRDSRTSCDYYDSLPPTRPLSAGEFRPASDYYDSLPPARPLETHSKPSDPPPRPPRTERPMHHNYPQVDLNLSVPCQNSQSLISDGEDEYLVPPSNEITSVLPSPPRPPRTQSSNEPDYVNKSEIHKDCSQMSSSLQDSIVSSDTDQDMLYKSPVTSVILESVSDEMSGSLDSSIYQYPPTNPLPISPDIMRSPVPFGGVSDAGSDKDDIHAVFRSDKTKSFKRMSAIEEIQPLTQPIPFPRTIKPSPSLKANRPAVAKKPLSIRRQLSSPVHYGDANNDVKLNNIKKDKLDEIPFSSVSLSSPQVPASKYRVPYEADTLSGTKQIVEEKRQS